MRRTSVIETGTKYGVCFGLVGLVAGMAYGPEIYEAIADPQINESIKIMARSFNEESIMPERFIHLRAYGTPLFIVGAFLGYISGSLTGIVLKTYQWAKDGDTRSRNRCLDR